MRNRFISILILFSLFTSGAQAQDKSIEDIVLSDLRWEWEVFDEQSGSHVPFFEHSRTRVVRFLLDLNKFGESILKLELGANYFVWIDNQLVYSSNSPETTYFDIDSLRQNLHRNKAYFKIYSSQFDDRVLRTKIIRKGRKDGIKKEKELYELRSEGNETDLFIMVSIVILSLIVIFRAFNYRLFQEYTALGKAIRVKQNFEIIIAHDAISWPSIGFMAFYTLLVAGSFINFGLFDKNGVIDLVFKMAEDNSILQGLKLSLICFSLMLLKFLLIAVTSALFKIKKVRLIHFYTYFRYSVLISFLLFIISMINGIFDGYLVANGWSTIQIVAIVLWLGRPILIFFVLNKIYTFRKLHLFSYLCSTELIPLLLFFKVFLK